MDNLTQDLINDRLEQIAAMDAWMKTNESIMAPVEVKVAVMKHTDYCKEQLKKLGGEA